jgi:hypothetical protein
LDPVRSIRKPIIKKLYRNLFIIIDYINNERTIPPQSSVASDVMLDSIGIPRQLVGRRHPVWIPGFRLSRLCHNSKKCLNSNCHAGLDPASRNVKTFKLRWIPGQARNDKTAKYLYLLIATQPLSPE